MDEDLTKTDDEVEEEDQDADLLGEEGEFLADSDIPGDKEEGFPDEQEELGLDDLEDGE